MMKRIACAIILAAVAGTAFAQDFKLDGYINSGLGLVITDRQIDDGNGGAKNADPYLAAFGVDSEQWGYRFRLNGAYANEAKSTGIKLRLQGQAKTDKDGAPVISLPIASGWLTFFNVFTLNAGIIDDSSWVSGGGILNDDMGEGLGLLLKVSPVSGLDVGFGGYAISSLGSGDNNILAAGINKNSVNVWGAKYTFNLAYTLPDAFKFTATFRPKNDAGGDSNRDESMKSIIGVRLLAVKNLTAIVEAELDNLQEFDPKGKATIYETIGYKIDGLSFGLNAGEYILTKEGSDLGIRLNPWMSYAFGAIVPRLDFVYFMGGKIDGSDNDEEGKYHRKGYAATNNAKDSVIAIHPSVTFNIDGKTSLEIGDVVNFEQWHTDYYGAAGHLKNSKITNVFYIDVKWSF
ncbi:MAG: hypothetical protein LBG43_01385 [Treponema sp.]|jgi:hypothetical protein|nr:hypothetical protein [Treponema sp.]